jgi:hypothetical protein
MAQQMIGENSWMDNDIFFCVFGSRGTIDF